MRKTRHYALSLLILAWVGFFGVAAFRLEKHVVAIVALATVAIPLAIYVARIVDRITDVVIAWIKRPKAAAPAPRVVDRTQRKPQPVTVRRERPTSSGRFVLR